MVSCYGTLDISASYKNGTHPGILQGAWPTSSLPFITLTAQGSLILLILWSNLILPKCLDICKSSSNAAKTHIAQYKLTVSF